MAIIVTIAISKNDKKKKGKSEMLFDHDVKLFIRACLTGRVVAITHSKAVGSNLSILVLLLAFYTFYVTPG